MATRFVCSLSVGDTTRTLSLWRDDDDERTIMSCTRNVDEYIYIKIYRECVCVCFPTHTQHNQLVVVGCSAFLAIYTKKRTSTQWNYGRGYRGLPWREGDLLRAREATPIY